MRVVILGCGRVGAELATILSRDGHDVLVIDRNQEAFGRLRQEFTGTTMVGDGTDEDVLERAGVPEADAFVACTNGDNRNILSAQIAKHTFEVPRVICRIYDPQRQEIYNKLGLESISPTVIGATLLRNAIITPGSTTSSMQSLAEGRSVPVNKPPAPSGNAPSTNTPAGSAAGGNARTKA